MDMTVWSKRIKCLVLVCLFTSIGNFISTTKAGKPVTPLQAVPGLLILLVITLIGFLIHEIIGRILGKNLPAIAYVSLVAIIVTIPGLFPFAQYCIDSMGKIGLLPLCTPILAYAGISIGKDLDAFKKQGPAIVVIALFTFVGTYLGSAIIAEIVLRVTGVI